MARTVRKSERLSLPQEPAHYYDVEYDMDYEPQPAPSQSHKFEQDITGTSTTGFNTNKT